MTDIAPAYVVFAVGVIAQAAITWFRVGALEKRIEENESRIEDQEERLRHIERFQSAQEAINELRKGHRQV